MSSLSDWSFQSRGPECLGGHSPLPERVVGGADPQTRGVPFPDILFELPGDRHFLFSPVPPLPEVSNFYQFLIPV